MSVTMANQPRLITLDDDYDAINAYFYEQGWTDGLPIVPPTEERVAAMIAGSGLEATDVVAVLEPRKGLATVEKIAACAVMAGCRPEYMPVLIAGVRAVAEPQFNLYGVLTSTHNASVLLLVNGPIRERLQINDGRLKHPNQWHATTTIGRAFQLIMQNIAGIPGSTQSETQGHIGRYHHIIAENEVHSPWQPLHVDQGFAPGDSTVTVFGACPPQHIDNMGSTDAQGVLMSICDSMATAGNRNTQGEGYPLLLLGPQHASTIAKDGFSKADVQRYLFEHARLPLSRVPKGDLVSMSQKWRKFYCSHNEDARLPIADRPEDIYVVVMGGTGTHSMFVQTQLGSRPVTKKIEERS